MTGMSLSQTAQIYAKEDTVAQEHLLKKNVNKISSPNNIKQSSSMYAAL